MLRIPTLVWQWANGNKQYCDCSESLYEEGCLTSERLFVRPRREGYTDESCARWSVLIFVDSKWTSRRKCARSIRASLSSEVRCVGDLCHSAPVRFPYYSHDVNASSFKFYLYSGESRITYSFSRVDSYHDRNQVAASRDATCLTD